MTRRVRTGSTTNALARSLLVGLSLLWLLGVVGSGVVLKRLIDRYSDDELHESATILLSLVAYTDDLLVTAAVLGERAPLVEGRHEHERYVFLVRDASGRVLLHGRGSEAVPVDAPLREGFATAGDWRVVTLADPARRRFVQLADPLAERREALVSALVWLTLPLGALLAFAAYIVYRASRTLVRQVEATAGAVARQDPKALGALPLDGVVTEMRPAVEATNALLARLAAALEAERSFTYNSAHELRTPIAGALAQGQLLAAGTAGTPHQAQAEALVAALSRLARLAERLLALARAEGAQALAAEPVDLQTVVGLTVDEFARDSRLAGRSLVADCAPARIRGDLDAAGLALRNLVENALVHGVPGTRVRVGCGTSEGRAWLAVTDDGPGSDRDVASLTRRFVRGGHGEGAGLGLSIVETLARRMGARLTLASPPEGAARGFEAKLQWSREDTGDPVRRARTERRSA
ncbi:MAG: HAMP domain-containing histidine kinase [Betaproteobacteria bacterium]|nr:HAMP domain-containing histidine kinase [Betaproteobacteria bacterium]